MRAGRLGLTASRLKATSCSAMKTDGCRTLRRKTPSKHSPSTRSHSTSSNQLKIRRIRFPIKSPPHASRAPQYRRRERPTHGARFWQATTSAAGLSALARRRSLPGRLQRLPSGLRSGRLRQTSRRRFRYLVMRRTHRFGRLSLLVRQRKGT